MVGLLAVVGAGAVAGAIGFAAQGLSSRSQPLAIEVTLARTARHLLIPAAARRATNPLPAAPDVLRSARAHWADHCASCHGNDGKGETSIGRNLHPRAPDMTLPATQGLTDGELFWIIENGIKLTGMPAWGTPSDEDDAESWECVHLIRGLTELTEADIAQMRRQNPISRAELEQEMEMERFLAGEDVAPPEPAGHRSHTGPQ
jgi:mono/diheme cytochrome c family protein